MAIPKKFLLTKKAFAASHIERHQHMVTNFKALYRASYFFYYTYKFMPESSAHTGIGNHAMV
jgi:hypothetical protein